MNQLCKQQTKDKTYNSLLNESTTSQKIHSSDATSNEVDANYQILNAYSHLTEWLITHPQADEAVTA